jgi:cell division protein ZipA
MTELRWILLLLGVLLVAALAWWEWRRPRQVSDKPDEPRPKPALPVSELPREPTLVLPEIRPERISDLPVLEVADDTRAEPGLAVLEESEREAEPASPPHTIPIAQPAPDLPASTRPVVEWPPESERRIVALRLVAHSNERFPGRSLRQALAAEGFVSGELSIFHKPGPDGRAVLSAASLNKPGTFDPDLMDTQRFTGLNLFSVLPGPLPPREAFDELLASARNLNERLDGTLQDASGEPLTQTRAAALRDELPT